MNRDEIVAIFDETRAAGYDAQINNIEAMQDALMLGIGVALAGLPAQARILCVGAGTGTEIVRLAEQFPGWRFTAVEPAPAMMAKCREKIEAAGLSARCAFHEGYLETMPAGEPHDAATCLLVAHFFPGTQERQVFLSGIAARLKSGGVLINSDLSWPDEVGTAQAGRDALMDAWIDCIRLSTPQLENAAYKENVARHVGLLSPREMHTILEAGGFVAPACFFRMMMIGAWFSRKG